VNRIGNLRSSRVETACVWTRDAMGRWTELDARSDVELVSIKATAAIPRYRTSAVATYSGRLIINANRAVSILSYQYYPSQANLLADDDVGVKACDIELIHRIEHASSMVNDAKRCLLKHDRLY
jgi:hypothetical protein